VKESKPNIVVVMADQMTAFALSAYGNTVTKTPNIDALAARGTVFENAYCNYPLCAPARFSLMSGRLPSVIGAYDNAAEFPASIPTIAHYLRDAGYYTCLSGKMHFVGPDQHHGYEDRLTTEIYPADFSWTPLTYDELENLDKPRDLEVLPLGVSSVETVMEAGPVARSLQMDYDDEVIHRACQQLYDRKRYGDQRPLFMTVSFTQPHDPYVSAQAFWDLYRDEDIDSPRVPAIPVEQMDEHSRGLYYHYNLHRFQIDDGIYRRARHGYYAMMSDIDHKIGQLQKTLADCGMADNTILVFTSDHGDMIGERGLWFKKNLFDQALRVPLLIAWPGCQQLPRVSAPVSLMDLLPTLLEAGTGSTAALVTAIEGRSLLPLLKTDEPGRSTYAEHLDGGTSAPRVMLRQGSLKIVYSEAYPVQLYNLAEDPDEQVNLAEDKAWGADLARLRQRVLERWDLPGLTRDVVDSQRTRQLLYRSLSKGKVLDWEHYPNPMRDTTRQVRRGDEFPAVEQRGYLHYPE